jgi:outer membrane biosynthesis protein TonB
MSNLIIKNTQASTLDLTPMRDVFDVIVVLRPAGTKGDSREISEETASHEIVERVMKARWVSLEAVDTGAPSAPTEVPRTPVENVAVAATVESAPTPAPEPVEDEPEPEIEAEPAPEPVPEPMPVPAPTETSASSKPRQSRK